MVQIPNQNKKKQSKRQIIVNFNLTPLIEMKSFDILKYWFGQVTKSIVTYESKQNIVIAGYPKVNFEQYFRFHAHCAALIFNYTFQIRQ